MDERTLRYYSEFAGEISARYDAVFSPVSKRLGYVFEPGMRVLDAGAGSGRDVALLLGNGCDAYGVEPCAALRQAAVANHPELSGRLADHSLPLLGEPFGGQFDGVLCSAVLMHLQSSEMLDAAISLRRLLKDNGKLLLSVPMARPDLDDQQRDREGRLFTPLAPDYLQLLFERIGFHLVERWDSADSTGRAGITWCTLLFRAQHAIGAAPLKQIESVLNHDRKTATYKLALFRALAEIAITEFEQVRWVADGVVGIPIDLVCDRWIYYYWPLFESTRFIPQIHGESLPQGKPVAFRVALTDLVDQYREDGGLSRFILDLRAGALPDDRQHLLARVRRAVQRTIVEGPVKHARGSLATGGIFQFEPRTREIQFKADIWRELSLVGHWVNDATILRWAELTSEISRQTIRTSEAIDLLLTIPVPERNVDDAKAIYRRVETLQCIWTGYVIERKFDVDHIIPFSLWHNNDLWNLMPARPVVNSAKSDKLPTRELMLKRKDWVIGNWEILRDAYTTRFDYEAARLMGRKHLDRDWQSSLFQAVSAAIEFTAIQRGYARWQPL